jgi:hypothetical protein
MSFSLIKAVEQGILNERRVSRLGREKSETTRWRE